MAQPISHKNVWTRQADTRRRVRRQERKPNIPGGWVYVGTFVNPNDPGNDPEFTTIDSPVWQNSFTYLPGSPLAFRHGLDGQTDMIGMYDLTQGAVSGTVAFKMPQQWAANAPEVHHFPIELAPDVWTMGIQTISHTGTPATTYGNVKIFWPIVATAYP